MVILKVCLELSYNVFAILVAVKYDDAQNFSSYY